MSAPGMDASYPGGMSRVHLGPIRLVDDLLVFDVDRYDRATDEILDGIVVTLTQEKAAALGDALTYARMRAAALAQQVD